MKFNIGEIRQNSYKRFFLFVFAYSVLHVGMFLGNCPREFFQRKNSWYDRKNDSREDVNIRKQFYGGGRFTSREKVSMEEFVAREGSFPWKVNQIYRHYLKNNHI